MNLTHPIELIRFDSTQPDQQGAARTEALHLDSGASLGGLHGLSSADYGGSAV